MSSGWAASTQTKVVSDLHDLVPDSVLSDSGVDQLQNATGVSGELNVIVDAPDITDPQVIGLNGNVSVDPLFVNAPLFGDATVAAGTTTTVIVRDVGRYLVNHNLEYNNDGVVRTIGQRTSAYIPDASLPSVLSTSSSTGIVRVF